MYKVVMRTYENSDEIVISKVKQALNISGKPVMNYSDIKDSIIYNPNNKYYKPYVFSPSRKLFISELRFLNDETDGTGLVIYVDGCPGNHLYELSKYYPNIRFVVIDPDEFRPYNIDAYLGNYIKNITDDITQLDWDSDTRIYLIKKLCSIELIHSLVNLVNCDYYLWSNLKIRSETLGFKKEVTDLDVYHKLAIQYIWVRDTKPKSAMIVFKTPYYISGSIDPNDSIINEAKELNIQEGYQSHTFKYPNGQIFIQPWARKSSTEAKMVIRPGTELVLFDGYDYENKFNYYNLLERPVRKHNVGMYTYKFGYCECNDCAIELSVLRSYVIKNGYYVRQRFGFGTNVYNKKIICQLGLKLDSLLGDFVLESDQHGFNRYR